MTRIMTINTTTMTIITNSNDNNMHTNDNNNDNNNDTNNKNNDNNDNNNNDSTIIMLTSYYGCHMFFAHVYAGLMLLILFMIVFKGKLISIFCMLFCFSYASTETRYPYVFLNHVVYDHYFDHIMIIF